MANRADNKSNTSPDFTYRILEFLYKYPAKEKIKFEIDCPDFNYCDSALLIRKIFPNGY